MENKIANERNLDYEIDLFALFQILIKYKYLVVGVSIFIACCAFFATSLKDRVYSIEMIVQPGILRIGAQGGSVYIDTVDNIRALIESGSFNYKILKILKNKYGETSPDALDFKVEIPKGSNTLKIIFETTDVESGIEIENLLYKFLGDKYLSIVNYYKNEISGKIRVNKIKINSLLKREMYNNKNIDNYTKRAEDLNEEVDLIKKNTTSLLKQRKLFLEKSRSNNKILPALLYSNVIQQNIQIGNVLKKELQENIEYKELELLDIRNTKSEILKIKDDNKRLNFKKDNIQNIQIIQPSIVNKGNIKPNIKLNVLLAFFSALFVMILSSFVIEAFNNRKNK